MQVDTVIVVVAISFPTHVTPEIEGGSRETEQGDQHQRASHYIMPNLMR